MRASFLLVLALALLVGLGVAVAVKTTGLLNPPQTVVTTTPAPPPPPPPPPPPTVLVPTRNLYAEDTIRPGDVIARPLRTGEVAEYDAHKAEYLTAVPAVAFYRYTAQDILADTPLRKTHLKDLVKPEPLHERLAPGTRAVSVAVPTANSPGEIVQVGDWVDVYLTTEVGRTDYPGRMPYTGLVARHVQVIAKRDTLWSGFAINPPSDAIDFTLAANPYRAALIEYGTTIGVLSIAPVSVSEKKTLDDRKKEVARDPEKSLLLSVATLDSPEYKDEARRVGDYTRGQLAIGGEDLARVLDLRPIPPPLPPPPPPPPPITIETFNGVTKSGVATFPVKVDPPPPPPPPPAQYTFFKPAKPDEKVNGKPAPKASVSPVPVAPKPVRPKV